MTTPSATKFTEADAQRAAEKWGANCGPGALAAICGLTLDQVRPFLIGFDQKRYTNPAMMYEALARLRSAGLLRRYEAVSGSSPTWPRWPRLGLVRVQWEGPWTQPGVPIRARYRYTHWIGAATVNGGVGVFDINCINNGSGWVALADWERIVVPHIIREAVPRGDGRWHQTHVLELDT